jgi:bifunctional non-homologous end joining protein LigD
VVGFTSPKGSRGGFGALHLGEYVDGALTYTGRVGSGFSEKQLGEVSRTLQQHRRSDPPCGGPVPKEKGTTWVNPVMVVEVEYYERTEDGLLRQPVFLRFREDKRPEECVREVGGEREGGEQEGEKRERGKRVIPSGARDLGRRSLNVACSRNRRQGPSLRSG